jgi:hypothetical protein
MKGKGGPADIKLTEGLILLDGIAIPCTQIGQPEPVRKITAADDFIIPPNFMCNVNKTRSHCYWIFLNKEIVWF